MILPSFGRQAANSGCTTDEGMMQTLNNLTGNDSKNLFLPLHLNGIRYQKIAQ